jgi:hypothetical protein
VWLKADVEDEWMKFDIDLNKVVNLIFGKEWIYQSLRVISPERLAIYFEH